MPRIGKRMWNCIAVGLVLAISASARAGVPSETLLPDSTVGFVSVPNVQKLVDQWNKTQLGQLAKDPVMEPFVKDVQRQIDDRCGGLEERLGLSVDDIRGLARGEAAVAVIQPNGQKDKVARALVIDVTGNVEQAKKVLEKAAANFVRRRGKKSEVQYSGVTVTVFDLPEPDQETQLSKVAYFVTDNLLGAADDLGVVQEILKRAGGQKSGALGDSAGFQNVMKRAQQDAGDTAPDLRWFLEPFGYAEAMQAARAERDPKRGKTMRQVLQEQGFTSIQGVGGFVNLAVDEFQIVHRTAIYAPPPYEKSMKMLQFPNGDEFAPEPWVPRDLASYTTFHLDILNAFDHFGPMFDALFGEGEKGVWQDVLESLKKDPNGPQIDLRADLVEKLGQRVSVLTAYEMPIGPGSERLLFAVEAKDPKAVALAVEKNLKDDKTVRRREHEQYVIWETIPPKKGEVPTIQLEFPNLEPEAEKLPKAGAGTQRGEFLPNAAVTVAYGHLLVASHYDFMVQILKQVDERSSLGRSVEYQQVAEALKKLGAGQNALRSFSRTDEQVRPTYDLIREGKMPQSETMFGRILNTAMGAGKKGVMRKQEIDGSKMPDYEVVRRYLGPSGAFVTSEANGWFMKGVLLTK